MPQASRERTAPFSLPESVTQPQRIKDQAVPANTDLKVQLENTENRIMQEEVS